MRCCPAILDSVTEASVNPEQPDIDLSLAAQMRNLCELDISMPADLAPLVPHLVSLRHLTHLHLNEPDYSADGDSSGDDADHGDGDGDSDPFPRRQRQDLAPLSNLSPLREVVLNVRRVTNLGLLTQLSRLAPVRPCNAAALRNLTGLQQLILTDHVDVECLSALQSLSRLEYGLWDHARTWGSDVLSSACDTLQGLRSLRVLETCFDYDWAPPAACQQLCRLSQLNALFLEFREEPVGSLDLSALSLQRLGLSGVSSASKVNAPSVVHLHMVCLVSAGWTQQLPDLEACHSLTRSVLALSDTPETFQVPAERLPVQPIQVCVSRADSVSLAVQPGARVQVQVVKAVGHWLYEVKPELA